MCVSVCVHCIVFGLKTWITENSWIPIKCVVAGRIRKSLTDSTGQGLSFMHHSMNMALWICLLLLGSRKREAQSRVITAVTRPKELFSVAVLGETCVYVCVCVCVYVCVCVCVYVCVCVTQQFRGL